MSKNASELKTKIACNIWEDNLDEVIDFIKKASSKPVYDKNGMKISDNFYWSWVKNQRCKYVDIRIDMRDGGFVIMDRDRKRIGLDELKYQYELKNKK